MLCEVGHGITSSPIAYCRSHSCMFKYNKMDDCSFLLIFHQHSMHGKGTLASRYTNLVLYR